MLRVASLRWVLAPHTTYRELHRVGLASFAILRTPLPYSHVLISASAFVLQLSLLF